MIATPTDARLSPLLPTVARANQPAACVCCLTSCRACVPPRCFCACVRACVPACLRAVLCTCARLLVGAVIACSCATQSRTLNISKAVRNGGGGAGHVGGYANGAFMGHGHDEGGRRLALEGLPPDATDAGLREAMAGFGQVRHARVALDHTTGNCRGSGTVTFRSQAVARGAMAYNGHRLVLGHVFLPHQGHMGASFSGAHLPGMLPGHMPGYTSEGLYMPGLGAPGHPGAYAMRMSQHLPYGGVAGSHYGAMWDMYAASGYQQHLLAAQAQAQAAASQQYSAQAQQQYADAMAAQMAAQQQQQQQMGPDAAVADGGAAVALSPPPLAVAGSPPGMLVEFGERSAAGYGGSGGLTPSAPSA